MKTTNLTGMMNILSKIVGMSLLVVTVSSCDTLESDPDLQKPVAVIKDRQIFIRSNSSAIIDLNSKIQTNQTVRLSVTSQTQKGTLSDLGRGLLQYSPDPGTSHDSFGFTVYNTRNEVLKEDSVIIVIEDDSTHLPCGIYPADDYVYNASGDSSVWINVLANDIICGYDSTEIEISIYQPIPGFPPSGVVQPEFPPYYGTAKVQGNFIVYAPGNSFPGFDKIIYKLQSKKDSAVSAYGFVYLVPHQPCDFSLRNDTYSILLDSLVADSLNQTRWTMHLPVLVNDSLGDPFICTYQYRIAKAPEGSATINMHGINYQTPDVLPGEFIVDTLRYEVCSSTKCKQALVLIELKR